MAGLTTTDGKLYMVLVSQPEFRLEIQFVPPELNIQRQAQTQAVQIVGRNNPLYQYTAGEKLLNFQLDFHADQEDRLDVIQKCKWLESLAYNDGYTKPPERLFLVWGSLFTTELWVVKGVNYKLSQFHKEFGFLPCQAYLDLSLALDMETDVKKSDLIY